MYSTPLTLLQLSSSKDAYNPQLLFDVKVSLLCHFTRQCPWASSLILHLPLPLLQLPYANDSIDTSSVQKQLKLRKSKTQFNNFVPAKVFLNPLRPILVRGTSHLLHSVAQTWKVTENNIPSLKLLQLSNPINFTFQICV